jgi:sulfur carrier protein
MTMRVVVNGEPQEVATGTTVAGVVASIPGTPDGRGVAVALDGEVIPRGRWPETELGDGARVEIVAAVQGG